MQTKKRLFGDKGEAIALSFLQEKGMKTLGKNFLVREGEIDLVMKDKKEIVFVEVKTRNSDEFGSASEAITHKKIQKIQRAIERYFLHQGKSIYEEVFRIDAVCILFKQGQKDPIIEHFQNIGQF
jgi:putative endonuclease